MLIWEWFMWFISVSTEKLELNYWSNRCSWCSVIGVLLGLEGSVFSTYTTSSQTISLAKQKYLQEPHIPSFENKHNGRSHIKSTQVKIVVNWLVSWICLRRARHSPSHYPQFPGASGYNRNSYRFYGAVWPGLLKQQNTTTNFVSNSFIFSWCCFWFPGDWLWSRLM